MASTAELRIDIVLNGIQNATKAFDKLVQSTKKSSAAAEQSIGTWKTLGANYSKFYKDLLEQQEQAELKLWDSINAKRQKATQIAEDAARRKHLAEEKAYNKVWEAAQKARDNEIIAAEKAAKKAIDAANKAAEAQRKAWAKMSTNRKSPFDKLVEDAQRASNQLNILQGQGIKSGKAFTNAQVNINAFRKQLVSLAKDSNTTNAQLKKIQATLGKVNSATGRTTKSLANQGRHGFAGATNAAINFNRVIQDLPYGMMGVANNLEMAFFSFQNVTKGTKGFTGALRALGKTMFTGPAAILTALTLIPTAIIYFQQKFKDAEGSVDALKKKVKGFSEAVNDASSNLMNLEFGDNLSRLERVTKEIDNYRKTILDLEQNIEFGQQARNDQEDDPETRARINRLQEELNELLNKQGDIQALLTTRLGQSEKAAEANALANKDLGDSINTLFAPPNDNELNKALSILKLNYQDVRNVLGAGFIKTIADADKYLSILNEEFINADTQKARDEITKLIGVLDRLRKSMVGGESDGNAISIPKIKDVKQLISAEQLALAQGIQNAVQGISQSFVDGLANIDNFGDAFKNMANAVVDSLKQIIAQLIVIKTLGVIGGLIGGSVGSYLSKSFGSRAIGNNPSALNPLSPSVNKEAMQVEVYGKIKGSDIILLSNNYSKGIGR